MYRYYSTQRPVGPGTFPKPTGNKVTNLCNFDKPIFCEQIGRDAWGYVDYENPVPPDMLHSYEMVSGKQEFVVKVTTITTLAVEAENEDEAIEKACEMAWEYDADEINADIVKGGQWYA